MRSLNFKKISEAVVAKVKENGKNDPLFDLMTIMIVGVTCNVIDQLGDEAFKQEAAPEETEVSN